MNEKKSFQIQCRFMRRFPNRIQQDALIRIPHRHTIIYLICNLFQNLAPKQNMHIKEVQKQRKNRKILSIKTEEFWRRNLQEKGIHCGLM